MRNLFNENDLIDLEIRYKTDLTVLALISAYKEYIKIGDTDWTDVQRENEKIPKD